MEDNAHASNGLEMKEHHECDTPPTCGSISKQVLGMK